MVVGTGWWLVHPAARVQRTAGADQISPMLAVGAARRSSRQRGAPAGRQKFSRAAPTAVATNLSRRSSPSSAAARER